MTKLKINYGLASLMVIASMFAGWQTLLLVVILLLLFCDIDEQLKNVITKVVTFFIGYTLITMIWSLIVQGSDVLLNSIDNILKTINSYLSYGNQIDVSKIHSYFINPVSYLVTIVDDILSYVFIIIKVLFIIDTLRNKNIKDNAISVRIRKYTDNALNFISKINYSAPAAKPENPKEEFNPENYDI